VAAEVALNATAVTASPQKIGEASRSVQLSATPVKGNDEAIIARE
jgi:hypothetical protein